MLTMYAFSIHLVLLSTAIPTCAMPCVPLHSTVINLKSRGYPELLGLLLAYYAWVRSGAYNNALDVYYLVASGGRNSDYGTRRYAVRPASLDCDKFKKSLISRTFGSIARV